MRPKDLGTAAETAVVRWLHSLGIVEARRLPPAGAADIGDVSVDALGINIEVKNHKTTDLAGWIAEAQRETAQAGRPVVVIAKRRGKGNPADWYAIMPAGQLVQLLKERK